MLVALVGMLLLLGIDSGSARADVVMDNVQAHASDVEGLLEQGGLPNGRGVAACSSACARLWGLEHRASPNQEAIDALRSQLLTLRSAAGLLPDFRNLDSVALISVLGSAPQTVGWHVGTAARKLWLDVDVPAIPTPVGSGMSPPGGILRVRFVQAGVLVGQPTSNRAAYGNYGASALPADGLVATNESYGELSITTTSESNPVWATLSPFRAFAWDTDGAGHPATYWWEPKTLSAPETSKPGGVTQAGNDILWPAGSQGTNGESVAATQARAMGELAAHPERYQVLIAWLDANLGGTSQDPTISYPTGAGTLGPGHAEGATAFGGCAKAHPVDCATGNQWEQDNDLSFDGLGGLDLIRTYNSQAAAQTGAPRGPLGYGWSQAYRSSLSVDASGLLATVHLDDGSELQYARTTTGDPWCGELWNRATLSAHADGTTTMAFPDGRRETFASSGRLQSVSDRDGNETTLAYDGAGHLTGVSAPSGRAITLDYNADGTVASATGPAGEHVTYTYDDGDLTSVRDVDGHSWQYAYDDEHQLVGMIDPRGAHTTTAYDASHRVTDQTQPSGGHYAWNWMSDGKVEITDPAGSVTDETFVHDQLVSVTAAVGTSAQRHETFTYDPVGDLLEHHDGRGNDWTYTYDSDGNQLTASDPDGHLTTRTFDADRDVTSVTLPSGRKSVYDRDSAGHVLRATIQSDDGADHETTTSTYTSTGQLASVTDPLGHTTTDHYDAHGDLTSTDTPAGNETSYTHDDDGRVATIVSARGNAPGATAHDFRTTYARDAAGRLTSVTDPEGHTTTQTVDPMGLVTDATDAQGRHTQFAYDADGQVTSVTRPDDTTTATAYDADERMISQTDELRHTTTYTRDALGEVTAISDPSHHARHIAYDAAGNPTSSTDADGRTATTSYNAANRPTSVQYSSGHPGATTIHYDADGRVTQTTDDSGTTTNTYDALGRLASRTDGSGNTVGYAYDADSQITKITYPSLPGGEGGDVTRSYDADGNLASVTDWHGRTTTFASNADDLPATTTYPTSTGETDTTTYDHADQVASITATAGSTTLARYDYQRDTVGRVTQAATTGSAQTGTDDYAFNAVGELSSDNDEHYDYTDAGGVTSLDGITDATYDPAGQLTAATVDGGAATYAYDAEGERTTSTPLNGGATSYDYDQAGELAAVHPARQAPRDSAGWYNGLAVDADGKTHAWGLNSFGEIGDGTTTTRTFPVTVDGLTGIVAVAAGSVDSLALNDDGRVYSWGDDTFGELGDTSGASRSAPAQIHGLSAIKQISAGTLHNLALDTHGEVYSWGWNANGQLADATTTNSATPEHVAGLPAITQIVATYRDSFALDASGAVWGWGANDKQQLSDATTTDRSAPVHVQGLPAHITQISSDLDFSVALDADGHVWIWGNGLSAPAQLPDVAHATQISAGGAHILALDESGHVYAIGDNDLGQLGNGTSGGSGITWTQVPNISNATLISAGYAHSYALESDGAIKAWGYDNDGEIGNGQTGTIVTTPVTIDSLTLQIPEHSSTYTYDATGLRATKTIGTSTTHYTWDTKTTTMPMMLADTQHQYIYGPDDQPIEQIAADGTTTFLHHDQLGSTRLLTNTDGTTAGTATYTPYGTPTQTSGATSALGYAGQYTDPDTGLIYMRARDYDPTTGQFLTTDPLASLTRQPYAYAGNDPVNNTDPTGQDFLGIGHAASSVANYAGDHWRPIAGAAADVAAIGVCLTPGVGAACLVGIGVNAAFQSGLVVDGDGSTGQKVAGVGLNLLLAQGAVLGFGAGQLLESYGELLNTVDAPKALRLGQAAADGLLGTSLAGTQLINALCGN